MKYGPYYMSVERQITQPHQSGHALKIYSLANVSKETEKIHCFNMDFLFLLISSSVKLNLPAGFNLRPGFWRYLSITGMRVTKVDLLSRSDAVYLSVWGHMPITSLLQPAWDEEFTVCRIFVRSLYPIPPWNAALCQHYVRATNKIVTEATFVLIMSSGKIFALK